MSPVLILDALFNIIKKTNTVNNINQYNILNTSANLQLYFSNCMCFGIESFVINDLSLLSSSVLLEKWNRENILVILSDIIPIILCLLSA